MHKTLMDYGCHAIDTIVSCGKDTALPHALGSGPLLESEPIVIDMFPADDMSGYYTDMTRTVVRGEPDGEVHEMYVAVREAQDLGMSLVNAGAKGSAVHQAVVDLFADKGYGTTIQDLPITSGMEWALKYTNCRHSARPGEFSCGQCSDR